MEQLQHALEPYRHLDMAGWVGTYLYLPVWAGLVAAAAGVLMLLWGGGRMFRLVAAPLGAAIGAVWAAGLATRLGFSQVQGPVTVVASVSLFGLGLFFPPGVVFFAFGIPVGLITGALAGSPDFLLGFAPGFVIGGALGVVVYRIVGAVLSSALGGWAVTLGLMAVAQPFTGLVGSLAAKPIVVLAIAGCLAIVGIVFQLVFSPSEEERTEARREKARQKQAEKERKETEARWAKFKTPRDDG